MSATACYSLNDKDLELLTNSLTRGLGDLHLGRQVFVLPGAGTGSGEDGRGG